MRISSQQVQSPMNAQVSSSRQAAIGNKLNESIQDSSEETVQQGDKVKTRSTEQSPQKELKAEQGKLEEAITTLNEFLQINNYSSKFVLHEGLDEYYVQLVDPKTDEVIKEIPQKALLDSFYEMQKLAGVIVDERV